MNSSRNSKDVYYNHEDHYGPHNHRHRRRCHYSYDDGATGISTTGLMRLSIDWKVPLIVVLGVFGLACLAAGAYLAAIWLIYL